ncbi:hypothetical protein EDB87DRAFT_1828453 [Lactarius vividus]|nr:hypothetical protein EDB87DRAFT_1828453 [Lactarius vividus]
MIHLLIILLSHFHYGRTQQALVPAVVPLAVRSPYLNCWGALIPSGGDGIQATTPFSYTQRHPDWDPSLERFDLVVLVRVDNKTFVFLGPEFDPTISLVNLTNVVISPTQTMLTAEAGFMQINLTFLNPIEPGDWVKQSIPLSYMSLTAKSLDGAVHAVQVYSDLSAVWVSGNQSQGIYWTGINDDGVIGHSVKRQNPTLPAVELDVHTEWGTLYHIMEKGDNITWKYANESVTRNLFLQNGVLDATGIQPFDRLNPNSIVFAMSRDLGTIQATQDPIVWVVGYTTDPVINYTDLSGTPPQKRSSFYQIQYSNDLSLIVDFMNDFANASSRAQKLDQKILQDAAPISGLLGNLVSFATAQVYSSTQLTVATDSSGEFNKSDVMAFMMGVEGRVNPVETLYSAFPAFMYIDPDLGGLLLEPLFRLQASQEYTNPYATQDLGTNFPDVSISNSPHSQGVEESGNMLIMTYAHARASGNSSLISRYYDLLTSWADYLSDSTLFIHDQYSADGLSTDNQTNLAIKGIIAIKSMSQMSSFVDKTTDFHKYSNTSSRLYDQWKSLALAGDEHLLGVYGNMSSWTLGYNLFADVWLNTSVVESSVYDGQSSFINNLSLDPTFASGIPLDNLSPNSVRVDWNLFVAATTPSHGLLTKFISTTYNNSTLSTTSNTAFGAMYAPLALKVPVKLIANPTTTETSSKSHTGVVSRRTIRGILSGVAALLVIMAITLVVWRRRRQRHRRTFAGPSSFEGVMSQETQLIVTPFSPTGSTLTEVAPLDAGPRTDSQQWLVNRSSSEDPQPPLRGVVSVPVGLSSKELARLRSVVNESRSQPTDGRPSNSPLSATTNRDALGGAAGAATSSSEARILSEVNILRDEIRRLHAEISEPPPSYASGAA